MISPDPTKTEVDELKTLLAELYRMVNQDPNLQWRREHDKNHELWRKLQKYV